MDRLNLLSTIQQWHIPEYYIDIVICIDATASMKQFIDDVKHFALSFPERLIDEMDRNKKDIIKQLRVKVIAFRDYNRDDEPPMVESPFFVFPNRNKEFNAFVNSIEVKGGSDNPKKAFEALTFALKSDWVTGGDKSRQRHIILLFTNSSTLSPGERISSSSYTISMQKSLTDFYSVWQGNAMNQEVLGSEGETTKLGPSGRRLVLFAPKAYPWTDMEVNLECTLRNPIEFSDIDIEYAVDASIYGWF